MCVNDVSFRRPHRNLIVLRPSLKFWLTLTMFWLRFGKQRRFGELYIHFSAFQPLQIALKFSIKQVRTFLSFQLLTLSLSSFSPFLVSTSLCLLLRLLWPHQLSLPHDPVHLEARDALPLPMHAPRSHMSRGSHGQAGSRPGQGRSWVTWPAQPP